MTQNLNLDLVDYLVAEIAIVDCAGTITRCNRKWRDTAAAGLLSPKQDWNYFAECEAAMQRGCTEAAGILRGLRAVLQGDAAFFVATYSCPFNGLHQWFEVLISPLEVDGARQVILMHVDVSALQRDSLTGLPNRAMFDAQLDLVLSTARKNGSSAEIAVIDMNGLKAVNDKYGHSVGDEALKTLAESLKKAAGPDCIAARIGGDEFGVVFPIECDDFSRKRTRARLGSKIVATIGTERQPLTVSASVGFARFPEDGSAASELYKAGDKSMYAHKRASSVA